MLQFIVDDEGEQLLVPATVDYGAPFQALLSAGDYRYPDPDMTAERFIVPGTGTRTLFFRILEVPEGPKIATADALASLAALRLRGATYLELLVVGAAHKHLPAINGTWSGDLSAFGDLAALGSVADFGGSEPKRYVPVIQRYNGRRYLDPHRVDFPWKPGDQFLAAPIDAVAP